MQAEQSGNISPEKPLSKKYFTSESSFQADEFDEKAIFLCQFCGGQTCDQQNYLKNKIQPNAIKGLHSNWITDNILAMQRPSERIIKQFGLYVKFKQLGIRTILNLQQPGQHPYCGDGILPNIGFSYIPQNFFFHGIHVFNESWEDMTATTFEHMMKIMNIFQMSLENGGRIAVHCHAGRGRTLLVICSWLIYHERMTAEDTIKLAVQKRQGVLTRGSQRQFLAEFEIECKKRWMSFGISVEKNRQFTDFVEWQTTSLLNKQKRKLNFTPYAHSIVMQHLRKRLPLQKTAIIHALINPSSPQFPTWTSTDSSRLQNLKKQVNSLRNLSISQHQPLPVLASLLHDFYDHLPFTILTSLSIEGLQDHLSILEKKETVNPVLKVLLEPEVIHMMGICSLAVILDVGHIIKSIHQAKTSEKIQKEEEKLKDQPDQSQLVACVCSRFSLLLTSKRKYFPALFPAERECSLIKKHSKLKKYTNDHIVFISSLLLRLSSQLPETLQEINKILLQARKVDSNLHYLTKEVRVGEKVYHSEKEKKQIYNEARIK